MDLSEVSPTGPLGRILKDDLHAFVRNRLAEGGGLPKLPKVDFTRWGKVEREPMSRTMRAGARSLHRSWVNLPHVTQQELADFTALEAHRQSHKALAAERDLRLTPLPYIIKACALALGEFPRFNASLEGDDFILKQYINIGIAVDTPEGLVVPVIPEANLKTLLELTAATAELAAKARERKLRPEEMQGGTFSISSLGNIGGTAFTPIINAPEVAILGVSRSSLQPVWNPEREDFEPRLLLPLSLSYDHRAINGADAARFCARLVELLADPVNFPVA